MYRANRIKSVRHNNNSPGAAEEDPKHIETKKEHVPKVWRPEDVLKKQLPQHQSDALSDALILCRYFNYNDNLRENQ